MNTLFMLVVVWADWTISLRCHTRRWADFWAAKCGVDLTITAKLIGII